MHSRPIVALSALAGLAAGQATSQYNYPYTIDPNSVSITDRRTWCNNQRAQCPLICTQQPGVNSLTTLSNNCDPDTLTYSCTCENGISPNITQYSQTLPYYICQQWGNNCVANCGGANTCQDACRADHPCGAQDPYKGNSTLLASASASRAAAASATAKIPVTGFGGAQSTSTPASGSGSGAASAFVPGAGLSFVALCGSAFVGFALLL